MTTAEILEQVNGLPFGPNGRQSVAFLMRRDGLALEEAILKLEELVSESDYSGAVRKNFTGVR